MDLGLRKFIKELGCMAAGTAVLSSMPWLNSCTPDKLKEVRRERKARVALIGTGSRGCYHLVNLRGIGHAEVVALCDIYPENLARAREMFPRATPYADYRKLLEDKKVAIIDDVVSTGHSLRGLEEIVKLAGGKVCRKAFVLAEGDSKDMEGIEYLATIPLL